MTQRQDTFSNLGNSQGMKHTSETDRARQVVLLKTEDLRSSITTFLLKKTWQDADLQLASDCYWRSKSTT